MSWLTVGSMTPDQLARRRQQKADYQRRRLAALTPSQKQEYLAKRRNAEIPRQREERMANPEIHRAEAREAYRKNPGKFKARQKAFREKVRLEVLSRYGGACKCCGEDEPVFLSIDHINGDGAKARRTAHASGASLYVWLQKHGYPEGFQVLCYNCNLAKRTGAECPHRRIVMQRIFSLVRKGG